MNMRVNPALKVEAREGELATEITGEMYYKTAQYLREQ